MHPTVISSIKNFLLHVTHTSVQDYTTSCAVLMPVNVEAAVCVMHLHTMPISVASMELLLISDLMFHTAVSNICKRRIVLEMGNDEKFFEIEQIFALHQKLESCFGMLKHKHNAQQMQLQCLGCHFLEEGESGHSVIWKVEQGLESRSFKSLANTLTTASFFLSPRN